MVHGGDYMYSKRKKFITDIGSLPVITDRQTGETLYLPRYVLWEEREGLKPSVLEVSHVLSHLLSKYNLTTVEVLDREVVPAVLE